jgi:hypothetical protein
MSTQGKAQPADKSLVHDDVAGAGTVHQAPHQSYIIEAGSSGFLAQPDGLLRVKVDLNAHEWRRHVSLWCALNATELPTFTRTRWFWHAVTPRGNVVLDVGRCAHDHSSE